MKHFVIAATPVPGHVNPLLALAIHLSNVGHRVTVLSGTAFRERVEAAGLAFAPLTGAADYDFEQSERYFPERSQQEPGLPQLIYDMKHVFADAIPDQHRALRQLIAQQQVDAVIADLLFLGMLPMLMTEAPRPAMVACGIVPFMCRLPEVSPFTGPDSSAVGLVRNAADNEQLAAALQPATDYVSARVIECGGQPLDTFLFDEMYARPDLFLQFTTEAFEFPTAQMPGNVRFVGPVIPMHDNADTPEWIASLDAAKPVVFVTQGTIANYDLTQLLQPTLDALAEEAMQVVVTTGGVETTTLRLPANARAELYIPYTALLARTSVFVTNGGYNGVQMALRAGVPIVSAGATEDKPFVSARVAWSGCGIDLRTGTPTAEQIRDAVRTILADARYADSARAMSATFAECDALTNSTMELEAFFMGKAGWAAAEEELALA